ncbi:diacylglycerol kinase family protein [uncultured Cytophaga sp.]|uniref:diacylglycerol/lipid kinase family protein n=1 Tax=uncultured Cytophaga sp. TaxID=160238 RepID=UPI002625216C|nr:diacylglycerol kinase family protein [uncultured Cytophaga sp.]
MRILFVINPNSGAGNGRATLARIIEVAAQKHISTSILYTTGKGDDKLIRDELELYKPDMVAAGGGDGTIQLVARNLLGKNIPILLLPLGSANGLAISLSIPTNEDDLVEYVFAKLRPMPFDMLRINDTHICVHLADIGINAKMVKEYGAAGDSGMLGYAKHIAQAVKETPLLHYTIKTDADAIDQQGYMLTFANANMYGTGIKITEGSVHDGKFEIRNIAELSWIDAIKAGLTKFNIHIDNHMFEDVISCRTAEIFIDQKIDFQIDGEYIGEVDYLKIEILPSAITILIP